MSTRGELEANDKLTEEHRLGRKIDLVPNSLEKKQSEVDSYITTKGNIAGWQDSDEKENQEADTKHIDSESNNTRGPEFKNTTSSYWQAESKVTIGDVESIGKQLDKAAAVSSSVEELPRHGGVYKGEDSVNWKTLVKINGISIPDKKLRSLDNKTWSEATSSSSSKPKQSLPIYTDHLLGLQSSTGIREEALNLTSAHQFQSTKLAPSNIELGPTSPGSVYYFFVVIVVSLGVIAITYFVRSRHRRGRFGQAASYLSWPDLSLIWGKKPMSSPLPTPRCADEEDAEYKRGSSSSFVGTASFTNTLNRMVRDSQVIPQISRWTSNAVRSAYRRSQPYFSQAAQAVTHMPGMQNPWMTSKEKDDPLTGVSVEGTGNSMSKSDSQQENLSRTSANPHESRVNRKIVTTSLTSVPAPVSRHPLTNEEALEDAYDKGSRRKTSSKVPIDSGTASPEKSKKQHESVHIRAQADKGGAPTGTEDVSKPDRIGVFPGRDRPSFSPVVTSQEDIDWLVAQLPTMQRMERWILLYSKAEHGTSINTLYSKVDAGPKSNAKVNNLTRAFASSSSSNLASMGSTISPIPSPGTNSRLYTGSGSSGSMNLSHGSVCVLLIKDTSGAIFGCYTTERWHIPATADRHSYGTGESFVFTISPTRRVYRWSQKNSVFQSSAREFFAIGGGDHFAIYVSGDMSEGVSRPCATFSSPTLASEPEFRIQQMEVWGFQ